MLKKDTGLGYTTGRALELFITLGEFESKQTVCGLLISGHNPIP